jgi:phosphate starvation-inducible protein PhoH and related proteins
LPKKVIELTEVETITHKPHIIPLVAKNAEQKFALKSIKENRITIIYGPPGTGKTHLAAVYALRELNAGNVSKIVLTRPCVEAYGERLGYLPGGFNQKIGPYMIPIFDILARTITPREINDYVKKNQIQTIPLAFQRGLTFHNSFVVADEFQNTVPEQVRMFLTRMGEKCKVVVTGDPEQNDIRGKNGLVDAVERLKDIEGVAIVEMTHKSIVRDPLVNIIDKRYRDKS